MKRTFQALRIEVNAELDILPTALRDVMSMVVPGAPAQGKDFLATLWSSMPWVVLLVERGRREGGKMFSIAALAGAGGWFAAGHFGGAHNHGPAGQPAPASRKVLYYQSAMHPWVKSDKPGKCTVCGMDLVPVFSSRGAVAADLLKDVTGRKADILFDKQLDKARYIRTIEAC